MLITLPVMSAAVSSLEIPPPALHRTGDLVLPHTLRTRDVIRAVWHAIQLEIGRASCRERV